MEGSIGIRAEHTEKDASLTRVRVAEQHNYVAFFLTLACNARCSYCINLHDLDPRGSRPRRAHLSADEWIRAANRFELRPGLPVTLQGGEPTLHPGFFRIVNEADPSLKMDLLTNMLFDVEEFVSNVPVDRFTREAPYAPIRVSYHPGQNDIEDLIAKTSRLEDAGFRVGIYSVLHPDPAIARPVREARAMCERAGVDFRTKQFLGRWNGRLYGTYKYDEAVAADRVLSCECRTSEWLVAPNGNIHRCHADLYDGSNEVGHVLDPALPSSLLDDFRSCDIYGRCNPCDVKIKTDRFQRFGHTSVAIRNISTGVDPSKT